ncbi:MAG: hypothetical protein ACLRS8_01775 [Parabacteroides merdae]
MKMRSTPPYTTGQPASAYWGRTSDYWQYKIHDSQSTNTNDYRNTLDSLYNVYGKEPFAAEIRIAEMNLLQRERYQGNKAHQDSVQALIYSLCKESIAQYPKYDRINVFKNQLNEMETPVLNIQSDNNVYPGKDLTLQIKYVNTPRLVVRIYKSLRQPEDAWRNYGKNSKSMRGELVKEVTFKMNLANSYTEADSTLAIPMDRLGLYEYVITVPGKQLTVSNRFSVSRLAALSPVARPTTRKVLVTDLESGKPIEGATVIYYKTNMMNGTIQRQGEVKTDRLGIAILPAKKKIEHIRPVLREDSSSIITNIYPYGTSRSGQEKETVGLSLFTDRGIYRPGAKRILQRDRLCERYGQPACRGRTHLYRHPAGCQLQGCSQQRIQDRPVRFLQRRVHHPGTDFERELHACHRKVSYKYPGRRIQTPDFQSQFPAAQGRGVFRPSGETDRWKHKLSPV